MCGVFFLILSKSSRASFTPISRDKAKRCKTAFVEPPIALATTMAFSNASNVRMSFGLMPFSSKFKTALPLSYTIFSRLGSSAGGEALPGRAIPIASLIDAIVFAVYIPPQEPAFGHATC